MLSDSHRGISPLPNDLSNLKAVKGPSYNRRSTIICGMRSLWELSVWPSWQITPFCGWICHFLFKGVRSPLDMLSTEQGVKLVDVASIRLRFLFSGSLPLIFVGGWQSGGICLCKQIVYLGFVFFGVVLSRKEIVESRRECLLGRLTRNVLFVQFFIVACTHTLPLARTSCSDTGLCLS